MHLTTASGPNGMLSFFYQKYWHMVGRSITNEVHATLWTGQIHLGSNHTFITLIPEKQNVCTVADLCPISLCNVFYKLIPKVLANRLIVLLTQSAFVLGHQITGNILVAYELVH